ncbi:MAG: Serine--tRNA ligase [Bacteroidota bacterium]|jgi:seryl-tRNA synthetase
MLQIAVIRENKEKVIAALAKKNMDAKAIVEEVIQLDENRRAAQVELDTTLSESNKLSKDIGSLMKNGEKAKAEILKQKTVSCEIKQNPFQIKLKCMLPICFKKCTCFQISLPI